MDDKLYWMGNHAIMCMTGGSAATVETMVDNLPESVSTFKVLKSADGQKAIVWEDVNEKAQFYGTYYNEALDKFGNILPLTTGDDVIRGWDACMMSTGKIQLAYCAADALSEPENGKAYGQLDLIQAAFYFLRCSWIRTAFFVKPHRATGGTIATVRSAICGSVPAGRQTHASRPTATLKR